MFQQDPPRKAFKESCHLELLQPTAPLKRVFKYHRKRVLDLNPTTLKLQSIKRIHAKKCQFDATLPGNEYAHYNQRILALAIRSLKRMNNRNIDFLFDFRVSKEFLFLAESLKRNRFLRSINFCFYDCRLNNESLPGLCKALERIYFMKNIHLDFYENHCLNDSAMFSLSQGLKGFANLRTMSLKFGGCIAITDTGFGYIFKIFPASLEKVGFDFCECEITGVGLEHMKKYMVNLKKLKEVYLNFYCCDYNISQSELESLKEVLENLPSLPKVNIDENQNDNEFEGRIDEEGEDERERKDEQEEEEEEGDENEKKEKEEQNEEEEEEEDAFD